MKVVGLQTFIWSNNLKSLYLLVMFPVLVCVIGLIITFAINIASDEGPTVKYKYTSGRVVEVANPSYKGPFAKTIDSIPTVAPLFFTGVGVWFLIAWTFNKQIVLGLTHSKPLTRNENPRVYNIVENLCISRGLPTPKIYVIEDESLNAFASGLSPKSSIIGFTRGILTKLDDQELEAVAAHEITHILNYDIRLMLISIVFVGIIQTMSQVFFRVRFSGGSDKKNNGAAVIFILQIVVFILGFLVSFMIQAAISRKREFLADAGSVELVKSSNPMISALSKIAGDPNVEAVTNASVAQMFIYSPMHASRISGMFASHPSVEDRIKALRTIG